MAAVLAVLVGVLMGAVVVPAAPAAAVGDTTPPDVTIDQKVGQADPTNGTSLFTVVFSEPIIVSSFGVADIDTSLSTATGVTVLSVTQVAPNNGTTFEVAISATGSGTIEPKVPVSGSYTSAILGDTEASPTGIARDAAGNVYTTNYFSDNVSKITPLGVSSILGPTGSGPWAIALDADGNVYTANAVSNDVSMITPLGVSTILGSTFPGFNPQAIALDAGGNVYTANADTDDVSKITPLGVSTIFGSTGDYPHGIVVDAAGNVYTANYGTSDVSKITPLGVSTVLAGTGSNPWAIALDATGNVYTANYISNDVSKITPLGVSSSLGGTDGNPWAITVDAGGNVYTANIGSNTVSKITPAGVSTVLSATGNGPRAVTLDAAGNVYTANFDSNNVSKFLPHSITDLVGNFNTVSTSTDNIVTIDLTAPTAPVVDPTDGSPVSGTAEPGVTVRVKNTIGTVLCTTTADAISGVFGCIPSPVPTNGQVLSVTATDVSGNVSVVATVTVDTVAPAAPVLFTTNGTSVWGTTEPGATVTVKNSIGTVLCTTVASATSVFGCSPSPVPLNGVVLSVTATDPSGNVSLPSTATVDATRPTVTINQKVGQADPMTGTALFTVVFSEPIKPFTFGVSDIDTSLSTATGVTVTSVTQVAPNNGTTFEVAISALGAGTVQPRILGGLGYSSTILGGTAATGPRAIAVDAAGNVYTVHPGSNNVSKTTPGGVSTILASTGDYTQPSAIAVDADGNVYTANTNTDNVSKITPAGVSTILGGTLPGGWQPIAIAVDADRNIYTINYYPRTVSKITPEGVTTLLANAGPDARSIAVDAAGNVYTGNVGSNDVSKITPAGVATILGTTGINPSGIVVDAAGNVYVSNQSTNGVTKITPAGVSTLLDNFGTNAVAIAIDAAGNIYTANYDSETVSKITPTGVSTILGSTGTGPYGIAVDAAGNVYTANYFSNDVSKISDRGATDLADNYNFASTSIDNTVTSIADSTAPVAPVVDPTDGSPVSGIAESGSTVKVKNALGTVLCTTTATTVTGVYSCVLSPVPADGAVLSVTATDPTGNVSPVTTVTVDASAPSAPVVNPTNGSSVSGIAETGSTVTVKDSIGTVLCTATANVVTGVFSCVPSPLPAHGAVLSVTATDPTGNVSAVTSVTVDSTAPTAPTVGATNGSSIAGIAEAGSTVKVKNTVGTVLCTTTANVTTGVFSCTPSPQPAHSAVLSITATDAAGNISPVTTVTVDAAAPAAPALNPTNGSLVSGVAELGSTVNVKNSGGTVLCTTTANAVTGVFSCTPSPLPIHGAVVSVTATDAVGNVSPASTVTVDSVAPDAPIVDPTDGSPVTGSAELGSTVKVKNAVGTVLCTTTANAVTGVFSCNPLPLPANNAVLSITATDATGNVSPTTTVTVDAVAPTAPVVNPTNGPTVSGTAESASTVTVKNAIGTVLCTTTAAAGTGAFSCAPSPVPTNGAVLSVTATDAAGNVSLVTSVTVDSIAPATPVVNLSNGLLASGVAEAGSTVKVTYGAGTVLCTTTAAAVTGAFSCAPGAVHGVVLSVTATDAAGNESPVSSVTVDAIAPVAPVVDPSDGSPVSGVAEMGSTVNVKNSIGTVLCTTTANAVTGVFSCAMSPVPALGVELAVTATDATGNVSLATLLKIGVTAPTVTINQKVGQADPTNGSTLFTVVFSEPIIVSTFGVTDIDTKLSTAPGVTVLSVTEVAPLDGTTFEVAISATGAGTIRPRILAGGYRSPGAITTSSYVGVPLLMTTDASGNVYIVDQYSTQVSKISPAGVITNLGAAGGGVSGIAVDAAGNVYLSNSSYDRVLKFPWYGGYEFIGYTPDDGHTPGVSAIAVDAVGNVYTADAYTHNVRKIAWDGSGSTTLGTTGLGASAITVDAAGNVYTANQTSNNVSKITPGGVASILGTTGLRPVGIVVDAAGNVYTTNQGSANVTKITPTGVSTIVGTELTGKEIAIDANGNVFFADSSASFPYYYYYSITRLTPFGGSTRILIPSDYPLYWSPFAVDAAGNINVLYGNQFGKLSNGGVTDLVGNLSATSTSTDNTVTIDMTSPTVTINQSVLQADPAGVPANFTVLFSEPVNLSTFGAADIDTALSTATGISVVSVTEVAPNNGTTFKVTITATGSGTIKPRILLGVAADPAGNLNTASTSTDNTVTVDATTPTAPVVNPTNGLTLSGTAQPGLSVTVTDHWPEWMCFATADAVTGVFTCPSFFGPTSHGDVLRVYATNAVGTLSPITLVTVDRVAPVAPLVNPSNGLSVSGTAEAGSTVYVRAPDGTLLCSTTAAAVTGVFSCVPSPVPANGDVLSVTATDPAGNSSAVTSVTAEVVDVTPPTAPTVNPSNGSTVSGLAEAGSTVKVKNSVGTVLCSTIAVAGAFSCIPSPVPGDGAVLSVTATDAAGNVSLVSSVTVDASAPTAPTVSPTNGSPVSGVAEAGSTVRVKNSVGTVLCTTTAAAVSGVFSCAPSPVPASGAVLSVTATDAAGNVSTVATVTVDATAPVAPTVNPTSGSPVSGGAELGSTVTVKNSVGTVLCTATANAVTGVFSCVLSPVPANGAVLSVTATDAAGNISLVTSVTVDQTAPLAPVVDSTDGSTVSGAAEAGSTVTIKNSGGSVLCTATAAAVTGVFGCVPSPAPGNGAVLSVTATDPAGNVSLVTSVTVTIDLSAPAAPTVNPTNGSSVSGVAEVGSTVTVKSATGTVLCTTTANAVSGVFSCAPSPVPANGVVLSVTARDAAGNVSPVSSVTVDATAPTAPTVNPTSGSPVSGVAELGSTVIVKNSVGTVLCSTTANAVTGVFGCAPSPVPGNGVVLSVTATDAAGNVSLVSSVTVDASAPTAPTVSPTNGSPVSGVAELGSTVTVKNSTGTVLCTTTANAVSGVFSCAPSPVPADGVVLSVTATDASGNVSTVATVTVDTTAPAVPVVNATNGTGVSGVAEAGSTVKVKDSTGTMLCTATANATSGVFSCAPTPVPANGAVLSVTATDAAGNVSTVATVTVDATAPSAPVVNPTNGTIVSGTAEAGSTVKVKNSVGTVLCTTTAAAVTGVFSCAPSPVPGNGAVLSVTATDAAEVVSLVAPVTVDTIAPIVPVVNATNGSPVSGTAEAGATVTVKSAAGAVLCTATANATSGVFSCTPTPVPDNGAVLSVTATDPAGNVSTVATVTVDATAPIVPVVNATNGTSVSGLAEAGSTVKVKSATGTVLCTTTAAAGSGVFSCTPVPVPANASVLSVTATDPAGNVSTVATVTVDTIAPVVPVLNATSGSPVSGTAEAGSTVTVKSSTGTVWCTTTAVAVTGVFNCTPSPVPGNGAVLSVTATDPSGNVSTVATVTVDKTAPTVTINQKAGTVDPTNVGSGVFTVVFSEPIDPTTFTTADVGTSLSSAVGVSVTSITQITPNDGTTFEVTVTATDSGTIIVQAPAGGASDLAGNLNVVSTSTDNSVTVDKAAPLTPTANPSNGATVSGTGEPGSSVIVKDPVGTVVCTTTVVANSSWLCSPPVAPIGGTVLSVTQTDPAGNVSSAILVTVESESVQNTNLPVYRSLTPARLVDTRAGSSTVDGLLAGGGQRSARSTLTVQVTGRGGVLTGATTATLNIVAVDPAGAGFLTIYPCDAPRPNASTLNYTTYNVANAALTKLSATGTACIYTENATELIVDTTGYYPSDTTYRPLTPARLVDTRAGSSTVDGLLAAGGQRPAGSTLTVQVAGRGGVAADAATATLNIVAVDPASAGFLTVYPCDAPRPNASTLNYNRDNVANAALTKLSATGTACIYAEQPTQIIVDVGGYHLAGDGYTPLTPARLVDTRAGSSTVDGILAGGGQRSAQSTLTVQVGGRGGVAAGAATATLNIVAVDPASAGYLTVYPCDAAKPNASTLNYNRSNVANAALAKLSATGTVCIYSEQPTQLIIDVGGYYKN